MDPAADLSGVIGKEFITVTEKVAFHDVANEMLMEFFSFEDRASVLSVSQLSLKAVHVLAFALRGLVVSVLKERGASDVVESETELAAFGRDVALDDEKKISVMMEKYVKNCRGRVTDTYASCYRDKFRISESDAKELRKAMAIREAGSHGGSNRRIYSSAEAEDDCHEEWIHKK